MTLGMPLLGLGSALQTSDFASFMVLILFLVCLCDDQEQHIAFKYIHIRCTYVNMV